MRSILFVGILAGLIVGCAGSKQGASSINRNDLMKGSPVPEKREFPRLCLF
jgi:hypothetical protein